MNPVAIIQARMGSTRLPGKVMHKLAGKPVLWHVVQRVAATPGLRSTVVATTESPADAEIRDYCDAEGIPWFAGSEQDVLDRYYQVAIREKADPIVRVTSDCPFIDPVLIGKLLDCYFSSHFDAALIATAGRKPLPSGHRFPHGLDAECVGLPTLHRAWLEAVAQPEREHVTPFIYLRPEQFSIGRLVSDVDHWRPRLTVDYPEDFELARLLYERLYRPERHFSLEDILAEFERHPGLFEINAGRIDPH